MPKIVVVEDQQVLATVYRNKFAAEGYQVEVASDGEEGLNLITTCNPDLVILDVMLPKINGIEVLKQVRANPSFKTLPVIIFPIPPCRAWLKTPGKQARQWCCRNRVTVPKRSSNRCALLCRPPVNNQIALQRQPRLARVCRRVICQCRARFETFRSMCCWSKTNRMFAP